MKAGDSHFAMQIISASLVETQMSANPLSSRSYASKFSVTVLIDFSLLRVRKF